MKKAMAGLVILGSFVVTAATAAPPSQSAVASLVRGVITEVRHRDSNLPAYIAVELSGARFVASARTARVVSRSKAVDHEGGILGSWAEVKVIPVDQHMHDLAEGDQRLMHRRLGAWHTVAFTDEGNGFSRQELRRIHVPSSVIRRLHLEVRDRG